MADSSHEERLREVPGARAGGAEEEELSHEWGLGRGSSQGPNFDVDYSTDRGSTWHPWVFHLCGYQLCVPRAVPAVTEAHTDTYVTDHQTFSFKALLFPSRAPTDLGC